MVEYVGRIIYVEFAERRGQPLEPMEVITTDGQELYSYLLTHSVREGCLYCDPKDCVISEEPPITCTGLYHMAYWLARGYEHLFAINETYTWGEQGKDRHAGTYTRRRLKHIPGEYLRLRTSGSIVRRWRGHWNILDDVYEGKTIYCSVCQDAFDEEDNQPCSHVQWCDECGDFSTPQDRCKHIKGPNRLPDPILTFCQRCGYKQVIVGPASLFRTKCYKDCRGKCMYCHAKVADWAFLADLQNLPADISVGFYCPWSHQSYEQVQDSSGPEFTFYVKDFRVSIGIAGHGPNCYPLANRFGLQARCPVCGNWAGGSEFLSERNRQQLLALLTFSQA